MMIKQRKNKIADIVLFVILAVGAVFILFPIAWMLSTALKSAPEVAMYPPKLLPEKLLLENFAIAWSKAPFTRYTTIENLLGSFCVVPTSTRDSVWNQEEARGHRNFPVMSLH